jgi:hypothetical protein
VDFGQDWSVVDHSGELEEETWGEMDLRSMEGSV